ncbi:uncharacterized protein [Ptychodera flava]|uniref:uncharacterized protein isoform X2 n=1 Tax=Ptychodera flava TaxID=63121 RepID=UPI00396A3728
MGDQDVDDMPGVLIVGTEWWPNKSRLEVSFVQRDCACLLLRHKMEVHCTVISATQEEKEDAGKLGVKLLIPNKLSSQKYEQMVSFQTHFSNLKELRNIHLILGHDYNGGTLPAAQSIRRKIFPDAKLGSLLYSLPKTTISSNGAHEDMVSAKKARYDVDLVLSIGPKILSYIQQTLTPSASILHIHNLPSVIDLFTKYAAKEATQHDVVEVISPHFLPNDIETGSSEFSKNDVIAKAIGQSIDQDSMTMSKVKWKIRGVSERHCEYYNKRLREMSKGATCLEVDSSPFTKLDDVLDDIKRSQLTLLSGEDDHTFCIFGFLACVFGVPTLVDGNSSLATFLKTQCPLLADKFIVQTGDAPSTSSNDENCNIWKTRITQVLEGYSAHFEAAVELKDALRHCITQGVIAESRNQFIEWCLSILPERNSQLLEGQKSIFTAHLSRGFVPDLQPENTQDEKYDYKEDTKTNSSPEDADAVVYQEQRETGDDSQMGQCLSIIAVGQDSGSIPFMMHMDCDADENFTDPFGPIGTAVAADDVNALKLFVELGANLYEVNKGEQTLLHVASQNNRLEIVKYLLSVGFAANTPDAIEQTPLHLAAAKNNLSVARELISSGANQHVEDKTDGAADFNISSEENLILLLKDCVKLGGNINAPYSDGNSPLHLATKKNWASAVSFLLKHGANVKLSNKNGKTPLQIAVDAGNSEIADLLTDHGAGDETAFADKEAI